MMRMTLAHRDETSWEKGDLAYDLGDTLDIGVMKAAQAGIRPCSDEYAAFMTAFGRRVRTKQVSPRKNVHDLLPVAPATQDVWHAA